MSILLVHGLGVSHRYFARLQRLMPAPAPDLAGSSIDELTRSLEDVTPPESVLVANSLGCQVSAELAVRRPDLVAGLVLIAPTWDPGAPTIPRQFVRLLQTGYRESSSLLPLVARDYLRWGPARILRTAHSALRHPMADRLASLAAPCIVIRGEHDPICGAPWARLAAANARADLVEVAGAVHAVHWSHPEAVQEVVQRLVEC